MGIYSSAISLSLDSILRQLVRIVAERESNFESIGTAQLEHEVITKVIRNVRYGSILRNISVFSESVLRQCVDPERPIKYSDYSAYPRCRYLFSPLDIA